MTSSELFYISFIELIYSLMDILLLQKTITYAIFAKVSHNKSSGASLLHDLSFTDPELPSSYDYFSTIHKTVFVSHAELNYKARPMRRLIILALLVIFSQHQPNTYSRSLHSSNELFVYATKHLACRQFYCLSSLLVKHLYRRQINF